MTGSASQAMDVLSNAKAIFRGGVQRRRWQSDSDLSRGWRMTGSAYQAMDVVSSCESYLQRRVQRGDGSRVFIGRKAGGLLQNAIYIRKLYFFEVSIWGGFWRGLGEVSGRNLGGPK